MKSLFRSIRHKLLTEGKLVRYLTYALGEIFLIVVGILLALKINGWNEDRKAQVEFDAYVVQLKEDVRTAIEITQQSILFVEKRASDGAAIFPLLKADTIQPEELTILETGLSSLAKYSEIQIHVGVLGQLLNGEMDVINRDDELEKEAMKLVSLIKRRLGVLGHIYEKLNLASQSLHEFRGDHIGRLEMEVLYDLDDLKTSKKFLYLTQNVVQRTYTLSRAYQIIQEDLESFLAVLEEYE